MPIRPRFGASLRLVRHEDVEARSSRIWKVDLIEALIDGTRGGYIKLAWIPRDRFDMHFSRGVVDYLATIGGWSDLRHGVDLATAARRSFGGDTRHLSDQQVCGAVTARHAAAFQRFTEFNLERPYVGYAKAYRSADESYFEQVWPSGEQVSRVSGVDCSRIGLGQVLYQQAALWAAERGQMLHASDSQTDDARAVWRRLSEAWPDAVQVVDGRAALDGQCFSPRFPDWVGDVQIDSVEPVVEPGERCR